MTGLSCGAAVRGGVLPSLGVPLVAAWWEGVSGPSGWHQGLCWGSVGCQKGGIGAVLGWHWGSIRMALGQQWGGTGMTLG